MNTETLKETLRRELPGLLRDDPALRDFVLSVTRGVYADRDETTSWFDRTLAELQRDREEQTRKWEQNQAELVRLREASERRWEENQAELARSREEQDRRWEANQAEQDKKWNAYTRRIDRSIGALGARWGLQSERAFRDALAGILQESFGVEVLNINEFDESGEVFGRPDQVELDVIITNGTLLICELKSSVDKAAMYIFERKARFYERRHGRQADRLIVISPMIDDRAREVAARLGIETFGDSLDITSLAAPA